MRKLRFLCAVFASLFFFIAPMSNAAILPLEGRLPATSGGTDYQAYYDPNLGITWAADASISGYGTWDDQMAWVAGLTIGGVSGWRLPNADVNGDGNIADCYTGLSDICSDFEMAFLYYKEGINASDSEPFNIPFDPNTGIFYWSSTEFRTNEAVDFSFYAGGQSLAFKSADDYAWAVHNGDVATIPITSTIYLFGTGLLGLIGVARKKAG